MKVIKLLVLIIPIALVIAACTKPTPQPQDITLTYWGVFEPKANMDEVINEFHAKNPHITINYVQKGLKEYQQQLLARNGQPNGPDIFRYHNSWLPMVRRILAVSPDTVETSLNYSKTFYPVAIKDLQAGSRGYFGIPLTYDGLGLYYNKKIFEAAGINSPPSEWFDVLETAKKLRVPQGGEKLQIAGIAMGSTKNIDHWSEILALLLQQHGANELGPDLTKDKTQEAINFYRKPLFENQLWDESWENSTTAFAQGKVAMMFGVSWRAFEIQGLNPKLEFGIVPVPQLPGSKVGIASYWVEGVSNAVSKEKQDAAWSFLQYLAEKQTQQQLYATQASNRLFGEPYSRQDLADNLSNNPYVGGILDTAPNAKSTALSDKTFDGSLNEELIKDYAKAVNLEVTDYSQLYTSLKNTFAKFNATPIAQ